MIIISQAAIEAAMLAFYGLTPDETHAWSGYFRDSTHSMSDMERALQAALPFLQEETERLHGSHKPREKAISAVFLPSIELSKPSCYETRYKKGE